MVAMAEHVRGNTDDRKYVRPADVVRQTGLSKSAVFHALWSGELKAYRKGKAWLIPVEAVDRWVRGDDAQVEVA